MFAVLHLWFHCNTIRSWPFQRQNKIGIIFFLIHHACQGIFQKVRACKTSLGKNIQNFKIFWKRACFLSHLYLQILQGLLPCFLISPAFMILFSSSLPAKQFMTKTAWNFELLHVLSRAKYLLHIARFGVLVHF